MLTTLQQDLIVEVSMDYIGFPWGQHFNCLDFVRVVYKRALNRTPPPCGWNLTELDLREHEKEGLFRGYVLYLKHKRDIEERNWSHVAILEREDRVIHNSYYFGKCVTLTPIADLMEQYNLI